MFCSNCGKELNPGAAFCDGCGSKCEANTMPPQDVMPRSESMPQHAQYDARQNVSPGYPGNQQYVHSPMGQQNMHNPNNPNMHYPIYTEYAQKSSNKSKVALIAAISAVFVLLAAGAVFFIMSQGDSGDYDAVAVGGNGTQASDTTISAENSYGDYGEPENSESANDSVPEIAATAGLGYEPIAELGGMRPPAMTLTQMNAERNRIAAIWTSTRAAIDAGTYSSRTIEPGVVAHFNRNNQLVLVETERGSAIVNRSDMPNHSRVFLFESGRLIFAFYSGHAGESEHRLWFRDQWLFRWRHTYDARTQGNFSDFENRTDMQDWLKFEERALREARGIMNAASTTNEPAHAATTPTPEAAHPTIRTLPATEQSALIAFHEFLTTPQSFYCLWYGLVRLNISDIRHGELIDFGHDGIPVNKLDFSPQFAYNPLKKEG